MIKRNGNHIGVNLTPVILPWIVATAAMKLMGVGIPWKVVFAPLLLTLGFMAFVWLLAVAAIFAAYLSGRTIKVNGRPVRRGKRRPF